MNIENFLAIWSPLTLSNVDFHFVINIGPVRFLDVARSRSDARPDFRSVPSERSDPPAGGPGKEAAQ
eukprot:52617-Pyramimonas_sp.AAC.1